MIDLEKKLKCKMKSKKGLSQVVTTILLILLSVVMIGAVWQIINNFVLDKLEGGQSCFEVLDKIHLNSDYTCYNTTAQETYVSISVGEYTQLQSLLIALTYESSSETFLLTNKSEDVTNLINYNRSSGVQLPGSESGRTYIVTIPERPTMLQIAPKSGNKQCDVVDFIEVIPLC